MRNLKVQPITTSEKLCALETMIQNAQAEAKIDDIRIAALKAVARDVAAKEIADIETALGIVGEPDISDLPTIEEARIRLAAYKASHCITDMVGHRASILIADQLQVLGAIGQSGKLEACWMID